MRRTLGIAVFSGMLGVTAFGIFFTPVFFAVVRKFTESKAKMPETSISSGGSTTELKEGTREAAADGHATKTELSPKPSH
jgi:uncharacterized protein with FMN-binding domain